jgi:formylglycine-generating enzyme required for sulfatase activity
VSSGTATITVTTQDGGKTAICAVTVTGGGGNVAVTGVTLNKPSTSLVVGNSETLSATVAPTNATNKAVSWTSNNTAVATVSGGTVSAVAEGSATITVTTQDGNKSATCAVSVTSGGTGGNVAVSGVTLNKTSVSLTVGGIEALSATVAPANATNKAVSWTSNNTAVATVSGGTVFAVAAGNATITVTTQDGNKTATCSVTVTSGGTGGGGSYVRIDGGTFLMGSPSTEASRGSDETQHQVTVSGFYIGKNPVTQAEYQSLMGTNPSNFKGADLPVDQVLWSEAVEYCNRLSQQEGLTPVYSNSGSSCNWNASGYRLPTEAEWEYACRAGTTTAYSTGSAITTGQANFSGNGVNRTTPVESYSPNSWGLYDMHGNISEWCWDWYGDYSSGAQTNPHGAVTGTNKVLRGGYWDSAARYLRSAARGKNFPSTKHNGIGFRVARN